MITARTCVAFVALAAACGGRSAQQGQPLGSDTGGVGGTPSGASGAGASSVSGTSSSTTAGQPSAAGGAPSGGKGGQSSAGEGGAEPIAGYAGEAGQGGAPACDRAGDCELEAELTYESRSCPSSALTVTGEASFYIGGLNRLDLDFEWKCGSVFAPGDPLRGALRARLLEPLVPPLDGASRTFSFPLPTSSSIPDYRPSEAKVWLAGSGVPEIENPLDPVESTLTIRVEAGNFIGTIHFVGTTSSGARAVMAAPFEIAVPP